MSTVIEKILKKKESMSNQSGKWRGNQIGHRLTAAEPGDRRIRAHDNILSTFTYIPNLPSNVANMCQLLKTFIA